MWVNGGVGLSVCLCTTLFWTDWHISASTAWIAMKLRTDFFYGTHSPLWRSPDVSSGSTIHFRGFEWNISLFLSFISLSGSTVITLVITFRQVQQTTAHNILWTSFLFFFIQCFIIVFNTAALCLQDSEHVSVYLVILCSLCTLTGLFF